jgi:hypothetical protein
MKRLGIFVALVIMLLLFTSLQINAKEIEKYKISFIFQANDGFCIIDLKDPLGESSHLEKLGMAPVIIDEDLFLPMNDFVKMMGGIISWDSERKTIQMSFQGGEIIFEFCLDKSPDIFFQNKEPMISLQFVVKNLYPSDLVWNERLKIVILSWPLAVNEELLKKEGCDEK